MDILSSPHTLILNDLRPMHWAVAGAAIGLITLCLLFVANRRLGISTGLEDLCSFVLRQPYFRRRAVVAGRPWRLPFLAGLVLGGFASAAFGGGWALRWDAGMLDAVFALGPGAKLIYMFAGGLLIGFGTRLAGGCTSGHGIFGLSNAEGSGLATTAAFMTGGVLTTQILYRLVAG